MVCLFGERKKKLPDGVHRKLRIWWLICTQPPPRSPQKSSFTRPKPFDNYLSPITRKALIVVLLITNQTVHTECISFFLDNNKAIHQVSSPDPLSISAPTGRFRREGKKGSFVCQMRESSYTIYWLDDSLEKRRLRCTQELLGRANCPIDQVVAHSIVTSLNKSRERERKKRRQL